MRGVTLAATPTALGPPVLTALPAAGVTLRVLTRDEIPAAVATGTADLGLVDGLAAPSDPLRLPDVAPLTTEGVSEEPVCLVLPRAHPLAGRAGLRLDDLAGARWLDAPDAGLPLARLRTATGGTGLRRALRYEGTDLHALTALAAAGRLDDLAGARWLDAPDAGLPLARLRTATGGTGLRRALRYEGTDLHALTALAAAGHGLTVLPRRAASGVPGAVAVPLTAPRVVHRTELVRGGDLRGAAAALAGRLLRGPRGSSLPPRARNRPGRTPGGSGASAQIDGIRR